MIYQKYCSCRSTQKQTHTLLSSVSHCQLIAVLNFPNNTLLHYHSQGITFVFEVLSWKAVHILYLFENCCSLHTLWPLTYRTLCSQDYSSLEDEKKTFGQHKYFYLNVSLLDEQKWHAVVEEKKMQSCREAQISSKRQ